MDMVINPLHCNWIAELKLGQYCTICSEFGYKGKRFHPKWNYFSPFPFPNPQNFRLFFSYYERRSKCMVRRLSASEK
jgi:hypothetical protein